MSAGAVAVQMMLDIQVFFTKSGEARRENRAGGNP